MIRAFGYCNDTLDVTHPSRLCRGRERWIEALPDTPDAHVHRTVCSGAIFSDDSARDASRGLIYSGVSAGALLGALFPGERVLGFCETGDPRALPDVMLQEEDWTRPIAAGLRSVPAVRWLADCALADADDWVAGVRDGAAGPRTDGFLIGATDLEEPMRDALFRLVGFSDPEDRPARKYCAGGIPAVLELCKALVLLHLDKHAPVLAIYTLDPLDSDGILDLTARGVGAFPVPFAIPPMLARWDRALYELRMDWDPVSDGEFPVPPADDAGGRWSNRRRQFEEEEAHREPEGDEE